MRHRTGPGVVINVKDRIRVKEGERRGGGQKVWANRYGNEITCLKFYQVAKFIPAKLAQFGTSLATVC